MSTQESGSGTQTFNNDNLRVVVTKLPNCNVKFEIEVQPHAVAAGYAQALKNIRKEVSIPGFRKGKAPEQFLHDKYGSVIEKEAVDCVLQTGFNEAIHLTSLHPYKNGTVKRPNVKECSKEKGALFTIEFETYPEIPQIDVGRLNIQKITPEPITEKQANYALKQVASQFANYEPIEDRPVERGDFIDIEVDLLEGDTVKRVIENQRTEANEEGLPRWILDKIIGLKVGESAEGVIEQQEGDPFIDVSHPTPPPYRATITGIWKGEVPALDDELAKKVGKQTLDELKQELRNRLETQALEEAKQKEMYQLERGLIEAYPIDIPQSLIDRNAQPQINSYQEQLQNEEARLHYKKNKAELDQMIRTNTANQLKIAFLLQKVASDKHIEVTPEDVRDELNRQVALLSSGRSYLDLADKNHMFEQIRMAALDRKVKQFLLDNAHSIEG